MSLFKKTLIFAIVITSITILAVRFSSQITNFLDGPPQRAGISVMSIPQDAVVFIDEKEVGKTPYKDENLTAGEYAVKIQSDAGMWQGKVKLNGGTITIVNRELSADNISAAGEVLTLDPGSGATIVSTPDGSSVEIDGKDYGVTPVSIDLTPGEHTFTIGKDSHLKRSIKAIVQDDYNITINVDLAMSEAELATTQPPQETDTPMVIVQDTPTGFLRVREKASTGSKELDKVEPGDELVLLEELTGWVKIRMSDGTEGYVSSDYVEKKTP